MQAFDQAIGGGIHVNSRQKIGDGDPTTGTGERFDKGIGGQQLDFLISVAVRFGVRPPRAYWPRQPRFWLQLSKLLLSTSSAVVRSDSVTPAGKPLPATA